MISIIIPTYNAERTLDKCLKAIFSSNNKDFEVLVVDDGSKDNSIRIANLYNCRILKTDKNRGASFARNLGAKNANGDILLFIDSDIVIKEDTLNLILDSLKRYSAVFGIYTPKPGVDKILCLYQNYYAYRSMKDTKEITNMFYSYCAAIKKELFFKVGGFNESWTRATFEDVEFGLRLAEKGIKIYLNKEIEVIHHVDYNIKKFIKNYFYKSLDLTKFMLEKKKISLNNEGWTNYRNRISLITGLLIIPIFFLNFIYFWMFIPLIIFLLIFIGINFHFYKYLLKEKPKYILGGFFLNILVNIIAAIGIVAGFISYFKGKE
jgi:glycosyltransferase involved in cell wall biosynthesis